MKKEKKWDWRNVPLVPIEQCEKCDYRLGRVKSQLCCGYFTLTRKHRTVDRHGNCSCREATGHRKSEDFLEVF